MNKKIGKKERQILSKNERKALAKESGTLKNLRKMKKTRKKVNCGETKREKVHDGICALRSKV